MTSRGQQQQVVEVTNDEVVKLAAVDGVFYSQHFFPKTFRQEPAPIHQEVWKLLDSEEIPQLGLEMFRGSAKTTILRSFVSKRIAYAISRTIAIVSLSQKHSIYSLLWLRKQIENNIRWANTFQLRKGKEWSKEVIEIYHGIWDTTITVLALGISGQTRGINIGEDGYRPDLLLLDDICDKENTNTEEQRDKTDDYVYGTLIEGLAPPSECPSVKTIVAQTGIQSQDFINKCHKDNSWYTVKYPCFDEEGKSNWAARFPTNFLEKKKDQAINRNQLYFWLREMELKITAKENAAINCDNLQFYEMLPESMQVFIGLDPAISKRTTAHMAAIAAVGIYKGRAYALEDYVARGKNPEELWVEYYRMCLTWKPIKTGVESIAYQAALAWYFRQKMVELNTYFVIEDIQGDRRSKEDRIRQAFSGRVANGQFYVRSTMTKLIQYLNEYTGDEDIDLLDAYAQALDLATPHIREPFLEGEFESIGAGDESEYKELEFEGGMCP